MKYIISLLIIFIVLFLAQSTKIISHLITHKKFKPSIAFDSGGMPSSHAAITASLTTFIALVERGIDNWYFVLSVTFMIIVCYDAFNIRWYAGVNASKLNIIIKSLDQKNIIKTNQTLEKKTKEVLGHRKIEVFWGLIFGSAWTMVLFYLFSFFVKF